MKNQPAPTLLFIVSFCIAFFSATFAKSLDLSDRNPDFQYRIFYNPNDLLEACQKNFSDQRCRFKIHALVQGPVMRSSKSSEPLVDLPKWLHNQLVNDGGQPERICTHDERSKLAALVKSKDEKSNFTKIVVIPHSLYHCFSSEKRNAEEEKKLFLYIVGGSVVGRIRCTVPDARPNPICQLNFFPTNGSYVITFSPFPLRNLRKLLNQSPAMVERFLSEVPIPFPSDFDWSPMPANVSFSPSAEQVISEYEAEYE